MGHLIGFPITHYLFSSLYDGKPVVQQETREFIKNE